jgi:DNA helicase II / ATP-dependent DNA helicase PcrA
MTHSAPTEAEILANLNDQQKEAVLYGDGPLLVFAGAGSGKTRVLTSRAAYLVRARHIPPYNILCVTFTNKAANEMKERLGHLLGRLRWEMWIGTFHAICARLLRHYCDYAGLPRDFSIYDDSEQTTLIKECIKSLGLSIEVLQPNRVLGSISAAKNELIDPRRYEVNAANFFEQQVAKVYALYQDQLARNQALDFDDLIMKCVQMLENNPHICEVLQERFHYLLVDEYQDINFAQYRLVSLLAAKYRNLCVVGDDDQSIYGWRGADMRIILKFDSDFPDARVVKLEQNYRSTANILTAAWEVIRHNRTRREKKLWTTAAQGAPLQCLVCADEHQEAAFVVSSIERLRSEGRNLSDFAILYRINAESRVFEKVFMSYGIPYRIIGGLRFYDRAEIKDVLAYLRVLVNPQDTIALKRILNVPPRGIGDKTVAALDAYAATENISLLEAIMDPRQVEGITRARAALGQFGALYRMLAGRIESVGITEITRMVIEESGYRTHLEKDKSPQAQTRLENITELLSATQEYESQTEAPTLQDFLENVALVTDLEKLGEQGDSVPLMTIHSAKGLEFPVVFLVGMEEGLFPLARAAFAPDPAELEEERRLCYVGMTRAKEQLFLSWARMRTIFGRTSPAKASRFVEDIPHELLRGLPEPGREHDEGRYSTWNESTNGAQTGLRAPAIKSSVTAWKSNEFSDLANDCDVVNETIADENAFRPGERVRHEKFGVGIVVSADTDAAGVQTRVSVAFRGHGVKKLSLEHTTLEKI